MKLDISGFKTKIKVIPFKLITDYWGELDLNNKEIRIRKNDKYHMVWTLIHEIIEAANQLYELGLEHSQISTLTNVLTDTFMRNKRIKFSVKW